ncbi:acyltransferase [Bordetella genomosp. 9]|uniref:Acyltransferase n=1 Tax=Bordetella genomosp. 9 TaxID=1416803 RepID=A0A261RN68_9BORD|nr:acyltransferase [Bordetella genomosp. 9]OZI26227.1 acyltransferase [Bordetella genomosp. 9]
MYATTRDGGIDTLRGVSILLVLLHHFNIAYPLRETALGGYAIWPLLQAVARNGNYGVTIFFVISGFLITRNALERWDRLDAIRPIPFWRLRLARIVPTLVLTLVLVDTLALAGLPLFGNRAGSAVSLWTTNAAALGAWMNVLVIREGWINYALGVMWSLSVEMAFYLLFPLACVLLRRGAWLLALAGLLIVAGPLYRLMNQGDAEAWLYGYLACFDAIAIGCCAAVLARSQAWPAVRRTFVRPVAGIAMAALYLAWPISRSNVLGVSAMALGAALLLLGRDQASPSSAGPARRLLRRCGRDCYEIYLLHLIVLGLLRTYAPSAHYQGAARLGLLLVFFVGSSVLGALVSRWYSTPLNRALRARTAGRA